MENKQIIKDREQQVAFTNFTEEDFDGKWNKKFWRMKAGKSYYLPFYLAEAFGRHLVDREINKMVAADKEKHLELTDRKVIEAREQAIVGNINLRQQLMDKCIAIKQPVEVGFVTPQEIQTRETILKTNERSAELVKTGKVAASEFKYNPPKEKDEFEGL